MLSKVVIAVLLLVASNVPASAQGFWGGESPPNGAKNFPTSFSNMLTFRKNQYGYGDCFSGYDTGSAPCHLDNGFAPGSDFDSGILSTNVPQGYGLNVDLSELQKPWAGIVNRPWKAIFWQLLPTVLWCTGLVIGFRFVFWIISTWHPTA